MKRFSVIQSTDGAVGYPKGFDSLKEAKDFYEKCEKGAILSVRRGLNERILKYKNLSLEQVNSLMGWT